MRVESTDDPVAYRAAVSGLLEADPLANTVLLGVLAARIARPVDSDPPATYLSVWDGDHLVGTAFRTPPTQVLLGTMPDEAVVPVAEAFARTDPDTPGVQGEDEQVAVFADRWRELTGRRAELHHALRLFRLGELVAPEAPGGPRQAVADELELATDWFDAFATQVEQPMAREHSEASARGRLTGGRLWWWVDDGEPVCVAGHTIPQHGLARIGPVYTPPDRRRNGYAAALTAAVARMIRDSGNDVCLFTDLRNPTTNRIYAAIGFEPVVDLVKYTFE